MDIVPLNDLSRISQADREAIVSAISSCISHGRFFKGPETERLENYLSGLMAGRPILSVANGTDALYLALAALQVRQGKTVATVANAGGYATGAALRLGAEVVLVDAERDTAQMSPESLEEICSSRRVDVVVLTHLYGLVGSVLDIQQICQRYGVVLIEDCAQSIGARVGQQAAGTFGDLATLSFYPTKNLGAFGDGGAVICATQELRDRISELAQYGWSKRYEVSVPFGINSRLDELQAVILNQRFQNLERHNAARRAIVEKYQEVLEEPRTMLFGDSPRFVGHLAVMVSPKRDLDAQHLGKAGVATGIHYPIPDHHQPGWRGKLTFGSLENTEWLSKRILTLPCFPTLTADEVSTVTSTLEAFKDI
jgi:dTDP-4-amino-4,6-dideoxygalactose transaminase